MKTRSLSLIATVLFVLYAATSFADASIGDGKTIFTTRCTSCHNVNAKVVGPALANVDQRHTVDWIVSFVHSPKTMIGKNDQAAVALYNQFNQIIMPDHPDLSSDDVKNILAYIKSETKTATAEQAPFARPGKLVPAYHPLSIQKNYGFFITYLAAVFVLVLLLVFAADIKNIQRQNLK